MLRLVIPLSLAATMCLPGLAQAQVKRVTIDGLTADVALVPAKDLGKAMVGDSKQDILDMARGATPMVVERPTLPSNADQPGR